MSKYTIVFSHNIPEANYGSYTADMRVLKPVKELECWTPEEVRSVLPEADIFITLQDFKFPKEYMDAAVNLKVIGGVGSGTDNIDVKYAGEKGIAVINTPRSLVDATSEMTIAIMLGICRGVVQYDRELRRDRVMKRPLYFYRDMALYDKTLGIIGMGRIGYAVAKKAHGLGMKIIYSNLVELPPEQSAELGGAEWMSSEDVLRKADVVSLHMPLMPETYHYINEERIGLMKPESYLINASRGPVVEEKALVKALKEHRIKGAALDVHEFEPYLSPEVAELDNVVVTPHCCTNIASERIKMLHETLDGVTAFLAGEKPYNRVI